MGSFSNSTNSGSAMLPVNDNEDNNGGAFFDVLQYSVSYFAYPTMEAAAVGENPVEIEMNFAIYWSQAETDLNFNGQDVRFENYFHYHFHYHDHLHVHEEEEPEEEYGEYEGYGGEQGEYEGYGGEQGEYQVPEVDVAQDYDYIYDYGGEEITAPVPTLAPPPPGGYVTLDLLREWTPMYAAAASEEPVEMEVDEDEENDSGLDLELRLGFN